MVMFFKKNKIILLFVVKINLLLCQDSPAFEISPGVKSLIFPGWGQASLLHKKRANCLQSQFCLILIQNGNRFTALIQKVGKNQL